MKETISKKQLRKFGLLIGFGFPILIGWLLPSIAGHLFMEWTLYLGITSVLIGLLRPKLLCIPYIFANEAWTTFYSALIVLSLLAIYTLTIIPISLVMKIFGYDPLKSKFNDTDSYSEPKKRISPFK